jgi:cell division cycle protein 20 (cofactor of APC complex)
MDMDMAYYLLTEPKKDQENEGMVPPAKQAYRRLLAEKFLGGRTRILAFRNKPPEPQGMLQQISAETQTSSQINPAKQHRKIPKVCKLCCCLWTFCPSVSSGKYHYSICYIVLRLPTFSVC